MDTQDRPEQDLSFLQALPLLYRLVRSSRPQPAERLTRTQIVILTALMTRDDLTMSQIAEFIGSSKEQATRAVAPLVEQGLVERFISDTNRTRVHIRLTERGEAWMADFGQAFRETIRAAMAGTLTEEEQDDLRRAVTETVTLLQKTC